MSNHFHLLVYQKKLPYLEKLMRSIMTSYSRYFNLRYKRTGSLFESRYKAVHIDDDSYLQHITRYIHLNPRRWEQYRYSSLKYYKDTTNRQPVWLNTKPILDLFEDTDEYMQFVADYQEQRDILSELKYQLADT
ncbi:transposase [Candidatus Nomurabacteria bacterium]|nr:transposase [Candidatus Nomurabacteria bacterium]